MPKIKSPFRFWTCLLIFSICSLSISYAFTYGPIKEVNKVYIVKPGDTISGLYNRYQNNKFLPGEWEDTIKRLNKIKNLGTIYPGQKLKLPQKMMRRNNLPVASRDDSRVLTMEATAYTWTGQRTTSGTWPKVGTVAVDPEVIPLGSKLWVEGYGFARATDTGGDIQGNRIDVFLNSEKEVREYGRKMVEVRVIGGGK